MINYIPDEIKEELVRKYNTGVEITDLAEKYNIEYPKLREFLSHPREYSEFLLEKIKKEVNKNSNTPNIKDFANKYLFDYKKIRLFLWANSIPAEIKERILKEYIPRTRIADLSKEYNITYDALYSFLRYNTEMDYNPVLSRDLNRENIRLYNKDDCFDKVLCGRMMKIGSKRDLKEEKLSRIIGFGDVKTRKMIWIPYTSMINLEGKVYEILKHNENKFPLRCLLGEDDKLHPLCNFLGKDAIVEKLAR